jgi:uncharacterized protein (DUF4415 family)
MRKKPDPFMTDEDNPPLDDEFWKEARPIMETEEGRTFVQEMKRLGEERRAKVGGRPRVEKPKVPLNLRLDPDVVAGIRASGPGYNGRIEKLLRAALANGQL